MFRRSPLFASVALALGLITIGCDNTTGPSGSGRGLTLLLTDAPGDFMAATVTISEIYLQGEGRTVLLDEPVTYDLLELRDTIATLVQGLEIPPGSYNDLRLVVDGAYIEVEQTGGGSRIYASSPDYEGLPPDAEVYGDLQMPSLGSSGLKIKLPGGKLDIGEDETIVLIDFDVQESFGHEAGNSGKWVLHPVIRATDVTFGGHVLAELQLGSGVVLPQLGGQDITLAAFTARLTPADGGAARNLTLADTDGDDVFEAMFKGIAPGNYNLTFVPPEGLVGTFDPPLPRSVTVVAKETATVPVVTLTSAALASTIIVTLRLNTGVDLPSVGGNAITLASFKARLTTGGGAFIDVAFTDTDSNGTFEATFANLTAGLYPLTIVAPAGVNVTLDQTTPVDVDVAAGASETRAFVITAASPS
jgi:hypothetical protein